MTKSTIFTKRELEVIHRKMNNKKLNQTDSNYLSRFIRPKLKEIESINAKSMLDKMEYNQKIKSIENRIKKVILRGLKDVNAIILYGSAIQNNYKDYEDIDVIISTKRKIYKIEADKWKKIEDLKKILKKQGIAADIQMLSKKALEYNSTRNPNLIYQLKDHKVIYGKLKIPKKNEVYNADLHMKLDWSDIYDPKPNGEEIYRALRNTILVRLLLNKIVDNKKLNESLYEELGKNLIERLKNNQESKLDRKIALSYLKDLVEKTRKEIGVNLWEKNRIIKIIGRLIAGMVAHKILEKYTNRKESLNHLRSEVDNYRNNLSEFINEFNWNIKDKQKIKEESSKGIILEFKKPHFKDVKFPKAEIDKLIEETLAEILE